MNITEQQFRTALQRIQNKTITLELLNYNFQTVDELSGVGISGSISIDANADIRRSGSVELVVTDSSFDVQSGGRIWLDKFIRVWVGIDSLTTGEVVNTNCGLFIIDAPSYKYNATTNTLSLSLLDLTAKLTGIRNGYLPGIPTVLSADESIRQAMIATLELGGFTKYSITEFPSPGTIPNDLEFGQGATLWDLITALRDIYPSYECFFDTDGTFICQPIPTGLDAPVLIDDSLWSAIVIDENMSVDFQNVKNSIEVYGRTHEPTYFSAETTVSGSAITLNIEAVTEYTENVIYGFTLTDNTGIASPTLQINSLGSYPVQNDDGSAASITAESGEVYYCVQFKGTYWYWLGHLQAYGIAQDTNPDSPFYINGTVGVIHLPLFDGEYANCLTDDLAQQRAQYELYMHTKMENTITLSCVAVPWIDVNILVNYTSQRDNVTNPYIIKSVSFGLGESDTMSITMARFYEDYPGL